MLNFAALQYFPKATVCQQLLLDEFGYIIESDDRIFTSFPYKEKSVREWMPFLDSIYPVLKSLTLHDHEIRFEKVFPDTNPLKGYYDFAFLKVEMDNRIITVWSLFDVTEICIAKAIRQQQINENLLKNEHLEGLL